MLRTDASYEQFPLRAEISDILRSGAMPPDRPIFGHLLTRDAAELDMLLRLRTSPMFPSISMPSRTPFLLFDT